MLRYLAFVGCSVFELLHDLAEVSPKCTEDRCYIQYGIANVQFLSIGDDSYMNWDDRWWHVHTQTMLGETCLHGCPVSFFCFCWVLRLRAFVMILQKSLQNAIKTDVRSSVAYQMLGVQSGVEAILLSVSRWKFWYSQWLVAWLEFLVQTDRKRSLISIECSWGVFPTRSRNWSLVIHVVFSSVWLVCNWATCIWSLLVDPGQSFPWLFP